MTRIPGGTFLMGSEGFYPEEAPVHEADIKGLWMDRHQVTVAEFRRFVEAAGYVTVAERPLNPADFLGADPSAARARFAGVPTHRRARSISATTTGGRRTSGSLLAPAGGTRRSRFV